MSFPKQLFALSICIWGILTLILLEVGWTSGQPPASAPLPLKFHENHRLIQWCVNGIDEPEFEQYPFSEFKAFLQRKYYEHYKANVRFKYEIDLWPVVNSENTIGSGGILYQRAHFVFKSKIRRKFEHDVFTAYNDTKIEGLMVQVNYAPLGVGLPTGEFVHPNHFNCDDCEKPIGVPIGCRKRTFMHVVHPTVLVFHHKMKIPINEGKRRQQRCLDKLIPYQCLVTGLMDPEPESAPGGSTPPPPPSLPWPKLKIGQPLPSSLATCSGSGDSECDSQFEIWYREKCCPTEEDGTGGGGGGPGPAPPPGPAPGPGGTTEKKCKDIWAPITPAPGVTPGGGGGADPPPDPPAPFHPYCPEFDKLLFDPKKQTRPTFECKPYYVNLCRPPPPPDTGSEIPIPWINDNDLTLGVCPDAPAGAPEFDRYKPEDQCCVDITKTGGTPSCTPPPPPPPPPTTPVPMLPPASPPTKLCDSACGPPTPGIPPLKCAQFIAFPYFPLVDGITKPAGGDPIEAAIFEEPNTADCIKTGQQLEFGKTSEVHGNFVWYFQPCHYSARVRFLLLVVHSFQRGIYSIVESEDYYDLKSAAQSNQPGELNPSIPSPLFTGFPHTCEGSGNTDSLYSKTFQEDPFDYSRSFDECVQKVGGNKTQFCPGVPAFKPDDGRKKPGRPGSRPSKAPTPNTSPFPKCDNAAVPANTPITKCEEVCPHLVPTTESSSTTEKVGFIKRSAHGGINIVTNFCIMPICIFIARFYKETFNLHSYKGQKQWYWMHMLGAGGSTVLMYMGYFSKKYVELNPHVVLGDTYILCLGVSYITAWIRHKRKLISMIVELAHAGCGYSCFVLALACVGNAIYPPQSDGKVVTLIVYVASASLIVFYIGMTVHICSLDQKFGMKPRRLHFPTVEARFDDLPVPGRNVRKAFLIVLLCVNLPLTLSTLVL